MANNSNTNYFILAAVAIVAVVALTFFMQPEKNPDSRLGNAVEEMADGVEDAGRELDPHRTTGEKIGEAVEDAGERIQDAAD